MKARIAVLALWGLFSVACDGALVVDGAGETEPADGEVGEAETLWDGEISTLASPWKTDTCRERGRWAATCGGGDNCCPSYCSWENDSDCPAPEPEPEPVCGDGVVDDGETCDGDCPATCDAPDSCTAATLTGSADTCDAVCELAPVTACADGDGCCPSGCDSTTDNDCTPDPDPEPEPEPEPMCGDGTVDPGEACDGNCPTMCSSNDACTMAALVGSPDTCDAMCEYTDVTACVSNDGCCPSGCVYDADRDCPKPVNPGTPDCTDPSTWPQSWIDYENEIIALVNQRRAAGASCGSYGSFAPAGPVSMNPQMRQASRCHSFDMDTNGYFSHTSLDGRSFVDRLREAGYTGSPRGENIAAGYSSPSSVMGGWMGSDGHCANIMNPGVNRMGIGYTAEGRSTWTMTTGFGD